MVRKATRSQVAGVAGTKSFQNRDPTIVIGIDFGTTFSGVAWARSSRPEQININTNWNSLLDSNSDKEKVPSAITYPKDADSPLWGYNIPVDTAAIKWFKLCLLDEKDIPIHIRDSDHLKKSKNQLKYFNKHVIEVISDYLRMLWEHTMDNIERAVGKSMVDLSKFKLVVTLPAIWPAYAQARMLEAINYAGIMEIRSAGDTTVEFISEPEAAALATMEDLADRFDIKPNDHFVVCDAGGGTVDIITYTIVSNNPMRVNESVKGDGGLCGATFLDNRFSKLLRDIIPLDVLASLDEKEHARLMNSQWENGIKPQFCGDNRKWTVEVRSAIEGAWHPEYTLQPEEVLGVYKPITSEVVQLVTAQVNEVKKKYKKRPKFIILVGGFGRSRYLHTCLQEDVKGNIEVLQGSGARPWTAVCRGAVIRGLTRFSDSIGTVKSRISRASYGTIYNVLPWEAKVHHIRDKEWCPINQEFLAADQTKWFLCVGDDVSEENPISNTFWQDLDKPDDEIVTTLVYSTASSPPKRCDESVKELCRVRWSRIPNFDELPTWTNSKGETFRQVYYEIKMVVSGVSLDFEIFHEGKIMASKNVAVDFKESGATFRRVGDCADDDAYDDSN